jgi:hypothetical protein
VIFAVVVFCAMLPMDIAAAAKITFLEHHRPWIAGFCEVVNDWGGALSFGVGGAAIIRYGLSFTTVVIFLALGSASVLGTVVGYRLSTGSTQ